MFCVWWGVSSCGGPRNRNLCGLPDGGTGGLESYIPKPKWMRKATYDRKLEEIFAAEEIVYAHIEMLDRRLDRLLGR